MPDILPILDQNDVAAVPKLNQTITKVNHLDQRLRDADAELTSRLDVAMTQAAPGEAPYFWTSDLTNSVSPVALSRAAAAVGSEGAVIRASEPLIVASRGLTRIEPGRRYRARYVVRRQVNSPDPAGDGVRCAIRWFDQSKSPISGGVTVITDLTALGVGAGRQEVTAVAARAAGDGITAVAPPSARYGRAYVQLFGNDHTTDVEVIDFADVTDATLWAPDVSEFSSRLAAVESLDVGDRLTALEAAVTAPNKLTLPTLGDLVAATVPVGVDTVELTWGDASGDGLGGIYRRAAAGDVQSADGAWWKLVNSAGPARVRKLYIFGHSWAYVDDRPPLALNSFLVALQAALDAEYGQGAWLVANWAVGGTALGAVGNNPRGLEQLARIIAQGDADEILGVFGINDYALDRTATQFKADVDTAKAMADAAGIPLSMCTIGPFKGTGPNLTGSMYTVYSDTSDPDPANWVVDVPATAAKYALVRSYVDDSNAYVTTLFGTRAFDLWAPFNDPGNDGAILGAYRFDDFHINHAGKVVWADDLVTQIDFSGPRRPGRFRITGDVDIDQPLSTISSPNFDGVQIGAPHGLVRPLTIVPSDPLVDLDHWYLGQSNLPVAGWMGHANWAGNYTLKRLAPAGGGVVSVTDIVQYGALSPAVFFKGSHSIGDTLALRVSGTTFGEIAPGVFAGSALDVAPAGGDTGMTFTIFKTGGTQLGLANWNGLGHIWSVSSAPTVQVIAGAMTPCTDGGANLGAAGSLRFDDLFIINAPTVTSDGTAKSAPVEPPQAFFDAVLSVPVQSWQWLDAIEKKGEAARWHVGPIAQDVRDALLAHGLEPGRWGLFCEDDELAPKTLTRKVSRKVAEKLVPLIDGNGRPVTIPEPGWQPPADDPKAPPPLVRVLGPEPVVEEVDEEYEVMEPTGRKLLGLRLDQFHAARAEALRRQCEADKAAFETRLAALEARLTAPGP